MSILDIRCEVMQDNKIVNTWGSTASVAWLLSSFIYNLNNKHYKIKIEDKKLIVKSNYTRGDGSKFTTTYIFFNLPFDNYNGIIVGNLCDSIKQGVKNEV